MRTQNAMYSCKYGQRHQERHLDPAVDLERKNIMLRDSVWMHFGQISASCGFGVEKHNAPGLRFDVFSTISRQRFQNAMYTNESSTKSVRLRHGVRFGSQIAMYSSKSSTETMI